MSPIISGGASGGGAGALTQICDLTLTGSQASFDTNTILGGAIPSTYTHLRLYLSGRTDNAVTSQTFELQFNGDSGGNYYGERTQISGAAQTVGGGEILGASNLTLGRLAGANATASFAGAYVFDFHNYAKTTLTKIVTGSGHAGAGTTTGNQLFSMIGGLWNSTAAINRIAVTCGGVNFIAGSRFTLYGIS